MRIMAYVEGIHHQQEMKDVQLLVLYGGAANGKVKMIKTDNIPTTIRIPEDWKVIAEERHNNSRSKFNFSDVVKYICFCSCTVKVRELKIC